MMTIENTDAIKHSDNDVNDNNDCDNSYHNHDQYYQQYQNKNNAAADDDGSHEHLRFRHFGLLYLKMN